MTNDEVLDALYEREVADLERAIREARVSVLSARLVDPRTPTQRQQEIAAELRQLVTRH